MLGGGGAIAAAAGGGGSEREPKAPLLVPAQPASASARRVATAGSTPTWEAFMDSPRWLACTVAHVAAKLIRPWSSTIGECARRRAPHAGGGAGLSLQARFQRPIEGEHGGPGERRDRGDHQEEVALLHAAPKAAEI